MRQSNNGTNRDKTIALYLRISREDAGKDESYSISNQKKLLTGVARKMGFTKLLIFIDDGITGTSRDRKDFLRMIAELEKGGVGAVMVKDLSRLARDHIRADSLLEEFFPEHDIRFISVSEGIDSAQGEDEFTPFRNLMNEWYARDISKKRKLTNVVKGNAGEPLSLPPYGYKKDPDNPKRWIIDEEAAAVVRRIFQMTLDGHGTEQIAAALSQDKVLTPMFYWRSKGIKRPGKVSDREPHRWNCSTVIKIRFPACWSVPIAAITCGIISIRKTRKSGISVVPTTRATGATAQPRIISGWTFWNRCYYRKSVGLLNLRASMKMNLHGL